MKLLLDTHTFIWWDSNPSQLSTTAYAAIRDPANEVYLSVVSVWEIVIKSQLRKLVLRLPVADIIYQQQVHGIRLMDVSLAHVLGVESLPASHNDPFDRLLAAVAVVEGMELVTCDPWFGHYPVRVVW